MNDTTFNWIKGDQKNFYMSIKWIMAWLGEMRRDLSISVFPLKTILGFQAPPWVWRLEFGGQRGSDWICCSFPPPMSLLMFWMVSWVLTLPPDFQVTGGNLGTETLSVLTLSSFRMEKESLEMVAMNSGLLQTV